MGNNFAPSYQTADDIYVRPAESGAARQVSLPLRPNYVAPDAEPEQPAAPLPKLTADEKKIANRRAFTDFFRIGGMMILFMLMMDFLGAYVNMVGMFIAIPNTVSGVFANGGLAAVEDFYYNTYCAEGGKYFALSGMTDNICYCFNVLIYCIPFMIFALRHKMRGTIFNKGKGFTAPMFIAAAVIGIGLINIWAELYYYAATYNWFPSLDLDKIFDLFEVSSNAAFSTAVGTIFYFISTCIFAPLGEEFVCRGVILGFLRKYGNWWAILMSAMLFGIMHMNFYQGPYAFLMGAVLGYVTVKTNSIRCAVCIHALNNTLSTLNEIAYEFLPTAVSDFFGGVIGLFYTLAMPAAIVLIIVFAAKGMLKLPKTERTSLESRTSCKTLKFCAALPNLVFIIFCLFYCVMLILPY